MSVDSAVTGAAVLLDARLIAGTVDVMGSQPCTFILCVLRKYLLHTSLLHRSQTTRSTRRDDDDDDEPGVEVRGPGSLLPVAAGPNPFSRNSSCGSPPKPSDFLPIRAPMRCSISAKVSGVGLTGVSVAVEVPPDSEPGVGKGGSRGGPGREDGSPPDAAAAAAATAAMAAETSRSPLLMR